jgi:hypothetical protein
MLISKMVKGKEEEVDIEECWDSICKILRIARILTCPGGKQYEQTRLAMMCERLQDLEGLNFHYKSHPFGISIPEEFVRLQND